jgi:hypothetical protein
MQQAKAEDDKVDAFMLLSDQKNDQSIAHLSVTVAHIPMITAAITLATTLSRTDRLN